ncbi:hypothetical protein F2Q69_00050380 [Brassica cretica]|uniref:Uncharacterized protein n=1 Tax=Brassica cretica TaxID=69181 RepID=A0A8S9Q012_BRACR|nr:hypothetical protein F2Q69_00050380 [Brassica cretica]
MTDSWIKVCATRSRYLANAQKDFEPLQRDATKKDKKRTLSEVQITKGIGVPHGVLRDIWVHLEHKRGDKGDHWTSSAWERLHRSDTLKSL